MKLLALAASAALLALPVQAQQSCHPRAVVLEQLAQKYGETRRATGLGSGRLMEVFASDESGTWTVTMTTPNGITCLIAAGNSFEAMAEPLPADGDDI